MNTSDTVAPRSAEWREELRKSRTARERGRSEEHTSELQSPR